MTEQATSDSRGRYGITIPFDGIPLPAHREWFEELERLGYTDLWTAEVDGADGFTPLALAAAWNPSFHLGIAIAPVFTRGPALLAQTAAAMADVAPGRFALGVGTSSEPIVSYWNGLPFADPYKRARDVLQFLGAALTGEKVSAAYETFSVRGFRLSRPPAQAPKIYLAALRGGMLRLAGRLADGAILNWLSSDDVKTAVREVGPGKEIVARIFVIPNGDAEIARAIGRRMITAYLTVDAYAQFQRWLGRGPLLEPMWTAWAAGDRKAAVAAVPDDVVDQLVVHGTPAACREHVARYVMNGVTIPALAVMTHGTDLGEALRGLAPAVDRAPGNG